MNTTHSNPQVRAVHCDHRASNNTVYEALKRCTTPLSQSWEKLSKAKRIAIKFNQDYKPEDTPYFEGMRQQLVSDKVARAVVQLLRERSLAGEFRVTPANLEDVFVAATGFGRNGTES